MKKAVAPKKKAATKPRRAPAKKPAAVAVKPAAKTAMVSEAPANRLLQLMVQALDEKKAENLRVFNVSKVSTITDYLVLATVAAEPHLRALRVELEKVIDAEKAMVMGIDTSTGSGWTVVDAFDVMVHLFTKENREKYRLELLWKDAHEVDIRKLLKE
jgi:ribosome-associated protein